MTRWRRGFTLVEVLVSLVVSGLVVSLAYASLQGGLDTRERLQRHRQDAEAMLALRAMLLEALRHAVPGVAGGPETFMLADRTGPAGPADSLAFLTRGIVSPWGTSAAWRVSLSVDVGGLLFVAHPSGASGTAPVLARVPSVRGLDIRALGRGPLATWATTWPDAALGPQAVTVTITTADQAPMAIVARMSLERAP